MAQINLNLGAYLNDPSADSVRVTFQNIQSNFTTLFSALPSFSLTGNFWADYGANIFRVNDRLFVANAAKGSGTSTAGGSGDATLLNGTGCEYFDATATFASYSQYAGIGGAFATKTSMWGKTSPYKNSIAVSAYAGADDTSSNNLSAWAYYGHAARLTGSTARSVFAAELEIANKGALVTCYPYNLAQAGVNVAAWIGCGGETSQMHGPVNPSSAAIAVLTSDPNANSLNSTGGVFKRGLVFQNTAIAGTNGTTGHGVAISMASGHTIQWDYDATGAIGAVVRSSATSAAGILDFVNNGANFCDTNGATANPVHQFTMPYGATNGFRFVGATSNPAQIQAYNNASANADMYLAAYLDGTVQLANQRGTIVQFYGPGGAIASTVKITAAVTGGSPSITASAGNLFLGTSGLATTATAGFIQIPTCSGTPTGVPINAAVGATLVFDVSTFKLWIYNTTTNTWRAAVFS